MEGRFKYLVQQVAEQSPFCDFTVKVGFWTKRYHRCVLVSCPYFEKAVRGNFIEKQKGLVDIGVGTTDTVNTAIMYLYDVVPDIDLNNVEQLLEQAEYFMVTGLKSTCIDWLRNLKITQSNIIYVLKLSSVYNFEVPACMTYIESHLPDVFQIEEALHFSKELVMKFFTDDRLSYVTMDEKISFLMLWVNRNTDETKTNVAELLETINFNDVSESVWQKVSQNRLVKETVDLDKVIRWHDEIENKNDVLIMTGKKGSLLCLNLQDDNWYQLKTSLPENSYDSLYASIAGIRNTKPEVYFTKGGNNMMPLFTTLNLESNERNDYKFILQDEDLSKETITNICFADDTLLVLIRKNVQIIETYANVIYHDDCPVPSTNNVCSESSRERVRVPVICDYVQLHPAQFINEVITVNKSIYTAVHVGKVTKGLVEIVPIFYLRNIIISQVCLNSTLSTMALLPKEKDFVILFDLINFKMEKFSLEKDALYTLSTTKKGFIIHKNKRCYCLTTDSCSLSTQRYMIKLFELTTDNLGLEYHFCNGYWIRFSSRVYMSGFEMSYIRHEELLESDRSQGLMWKNITIPDKNLENIISLNKGLFVVQLSKRKLRCHIHCPHCKYSQQEDSYPLFLMDRTFL